MFLSLWQTEHPTQQCRLSRRGQVALRLCTREQLLPAALVRALASSSAKQTSQACPEPPPPCGAKGGLCEKRRPRHQGVGSGGCGSEGALP